MKRSYIKIILCIMNFSLIAAMEERNQPVQPVNLAANKFITVELLHNGEPLETIHIPYAFAQASSVIRNNLAFQEEEEGVEPIVAIPSTSISLEIFREIKNYFEIYSQEENSVNAVRKFIEKIPENALKRLLDLLVFSDYVANEYLINICIKLLYRILKNFVDAKNWKQVFLIVDQIESLVNVNIQEHLAKKIIKNKLIVDLLSEIYDNPTSIVTNIDPAMSVISSTGAWQMVVSNQWGSNVVLSVVDLETYQTVKQFPAVFERPKPPEYSLPMVFSSLAHQFVMSKADILRTFSTETGARLHAFRFKYPINLLSLSGDGTLLAVAGNAGIDLFSMKTRRMLDGIEVPSPNSMSLSLDNQYLAFEHNAVLEIWDVSDAEKIKPIVALNVGRSLAAVQLSPDNRYCAYAFNDGQISIYDITHKTVRLLQRKFNETIHSTMIFSLSFSPDSKLLAYGCAGFGDVITKGDTIRRIKIRDVETGKILKIIKKDYRNIFSLGFSKQKNKLAFCAQDLLNDSNLYVLDLMEFSLKNIFLKSSILLWYYLKQFKDNELTKFPSGYENYYYALDENIRHYLYHKNVVLFQSPSGLPTPSIAEFEREKNRQPPEIGKKRQPNLKRFKGDD